MNTASNAGVIVDLPSKPPAKTDDERRAQAWRYHSSNGNPGKGAYSLPDKKQTLPAVSTVSAPSGNAWSLGPRDTEGRP